MKLAWNNPEFIFALVQIKQKPGPIAQIYEGISSQKVKYWYVNV